MISLCLIKHHTMKTYGEVEVELETFTTRAPMEVDAQIHSLGALHPGKSLVMSTG
jgi:hypothetical protein